ncbi:nitrate/nitrite sensor protein NarQ [Psychromonas sp. PRT-SC03]|nr:nitrate/nitrite sensor protein NarQ [Psychromonas sp. PRT-SC03]
MILLISIVHLLGTFSTFDSHLADTRSISQLGEFKIHTFKLIYALKNSPEKTFALLSDIEQTIHPTKLLKSSWFNTQSLNENSALLLKSWRSIEHSFSQNDTNETRQKLVYFIKAIDSVTEQYQTLADQKMSMVHFAELIAFILLACTGLFLYFYSKNYISEPINKLIENVESIKKHQYNVDFPHYKNEFGVLAQGMCNMSSEIQKLIAQMQTQVHQKTQELENANQTIAFLLSISQQLGSVKLTSPILIDALNALVKQANLKRACIELNNGTFIQSKSRCAGINCRNSRFPIIINGKPYGFLNYFSENESIEQRALIESFSVLIARALCQEENILQTQKILIMEERNIIARELHDSIAQSLSFLKMQCTVLHQQVHQQKQEKALQSIHHIDEAINDAYAQLRALLSTFRLSVSHSNLKEAIQILIATLQKQTTAQITLKAFSTHFTTDTNQHIHLLQIVREAIINAIKHADCNNIDISCLITSDNNIWISIVADGKGIENITAIENHYGISIMQQRSDEMGATFSIMPLAQGTEVKVIFPHKKQLTYKE